MFFSIPLSKASTMPVSVPPSSSSAEDKSEVVVHLFLLFKSRQINISSHGRPVDRRHFLLHHDIAPVALHDLLVAVGEDMAILAGCIGAEIVIAGFRGKPSA